MGAWVENKGALMTYHYREVPLDQREELVPKAKAIINECGFKVADCSVQLGAL